jgi:hypothetical protein
MHLPILSRPEHDSLAASLVVPLKVPQRIGSFLPVENGEKQAHSFPIAYFLEEACL